MMKKKTRMNESHPHKTVICRVYVTRKSPLHVLDLSAFHLPPCSFGNSGRPIEASRLGGSSRALA